MSTLIVDYAFNGPKLQNPDGTLAASATGCSAVAGPGATALGTYPNALAFGAAGKLQVDLPLQKLDAHKFCVRTVIKVDAPLTARQNLVETGALPLSLFLEPIPGSSDFKAVASVAPKSYGWSGASTEFAIPLKVGTWYVLDLIYDTDTVGIAVDGAVVAVVAFPVGTIVPGTAPALFVGTWVDGNKFHFSGSMAALQVHAGIPADLEALLDEHRNQPEWFVTYKYQQIKSTLNLGAAKGPVAYDAAAGAYVQVYDAGLIMFAESAGVAFEMHGSIFTTYQAWPDKYLLGYLVSDEMNAGVPGSRKSLFAGGGMYWSGATGAVPVVGQMYIDYEGLGEAAAIGLPTGPATAIAGGTEQRFQRGRMYLKAGAPRAFEVHGAILDRFLATGGVGTWGYPITNEHDIKKNSAVIGRASELAGCTFYWSSGTGAHEVHGAIREKYASLRGPAGELGFPTSDERDLPGASAPARGNSFEHGSLLWFGGDVLVCRPYKIWVGRLDTKNSEGFLMGDNDLYFRVIVEDNGHQLLNIRFPSSGSFDGHDILNFNQQLPITVTPGDINSKIKVTFDIWESDSGAPFGEGDDHLGTFSQTLDAANGWGLRTNNGVLSTGPFSMVNSISWAVQPIVNVNALSDAERWWGTQNRGTPELSYHQYGAAFRDVDVSPGWNDVQNWIQDGLQGIFYLAVVKGIASNGNCFGMSLEAIYSRKQRSLLSMPLNRFTDWSTIVGEVNVKHEYQVGAEALWWFAGQFLSGDTHDPVNVFQSTREDFNRGQNPVVCISQNYDFSGAPHCLMPIGWDTSAKPWKLRLCDPNFPGQVRTLLVDPDANTFSYDGGGNKYSGGAWSGGRFHYMPYSVLCDQPRTPVWDALALLLSGVVILIGSDADTVSLTDENGVDLDAFGADSIARLKARKPLDNKMVPFKGFNGAGAGGAQVFLRKPLKSAFVFHKPGLLDSRIGANVKLGEVLAAAAPSPELQALAADPQRLRPLAGRDLKSIVNEPRAVTSLDAATAAALRTVMAPRATGANIRHQVKGNKTNAQLQYLVKSGLTEMRVSAPLGQDEAATISLDDLGSGSSVMGLQPKGSKLAKIEIESRIGGDDRLRIIVENVALDQDNPLRVNVKPGLGGVDILSLGKAAPPSVSVRTTIGGKVTDAEYALSFGGGMRIRPSTVAADGSLKVGRIESLFGPLRDSVMIQPKK
jgi:hypothetical protein